MIKCDMKAKRFVFGLMVSFFVFGTLIAEGIPGSGASMEKLLRELKIIKRGGAEHEKVLNAICRELEKPGNETVFFEKLDELKRNDDERCILFYNLGVTFYSRENYIKALQFHQAGLKLAEKIGNKKQISHIYNNMGLIYYDQYNLERAMGLYLKSLKIDEEIGYTEHKPYLYNNIAIIYAQMGEEQKALDYSFKSLKMYDEKTEKWKWASTYNNIGKFYYLLGDYDKSLLYYQKSIKLKEEGGEDISTCCYYNLGDIYLKQNKIPRALEYFFKRIEMAARFPEPQAVRVKGQSYLGIGACYIAENKMDKAAGYLSQALEIGKKINSLSITEEAAKQLSLIHAQKKQFSRAYQMHVLHKKTFDQLVEKKNERKAAQLEMKYQFDKKQERYQMQMKKNEMESQAELKRQRYLMAILAIALFFATLLATAIYCGFRIKRKANLLLAQQQQEIKNQRDALKELNITKDKFFSIIAHDLKKPFSALIGFLKVAVTEFDSFDGKRIKELLATIHKSSEITYELVENLLQWARTQTGKISCKPEKIDLSTAVNSVFALVAKSAENKDIALVNRIDKSSPALVDNKMLQLVLRNLISNAITFTPSGGVVTISAFQTETHMEIHVADTGVGITAENLDKLFRIDVNLSTTGTAGEKGTGLGLILCREFITMNNGQISAKSAPGKGSTFVFTLPVGGCASGGPPGAPVRRAPGGPPRGRGQSSPWTPVLHGSG